MAKVMHRSKRSEMINTAFGMFKLDENGVFETDEASAMELCGPRYGSIFRRFRESQPSPKKETTSVAESSTEQPLNEEKSAKRVVTRKKAEKKPAKRTKK